MMAPAGMQMNRGDDLATYQNLLIKQTRKGCFQELFGCEANTEFKIATMENKGADMFYALEDTSCLMRFICRGNRPFSLKMTHGLDGSGQELAVFDRPFRCPLGSLKCCCYQKITATAKGVEIGEVSETCWCFVPTFAVRDASNQEQYKISMPRCCGGMCVDICAEGCCKCRVPFYLFKPGDPMNKGNEVGKIVKIWGGFGKEFLTDADTFETEFPADADADTKLRIVGGVFLINQLYFEGAKGGGGGM